MPTGKPDQARLRQISHDCLRGVFVLVLVEEDLGGSVPDEVGEEQEHTQVDVDVLTRYTG